MSQDRLREILAAAIHAATTTPSWRDGDELCIILADNDSTVLTTRGFTSTADLALCLAFHAEKARAAS